MPSPSSVEASLTYPAVADATLGRYRLFAKLGSGGQADVFLAIARGTLGVDKIVVIKRARAELAADAEQMGIFVDEARLTLRLNHPNLVHTYEVGEAMGTHFISMEHVEGLSLRTLFRCDRTHSFGAAIWLRVIADALSGLAHAHGLRDYDGKPMGIVHRDISPHNIIVSYDGVTKLIDFGIATSRHDSGGDPGVVTGKVAYMAPERARGAPADRRSDLFAMGVVLWEMLSRRRMFDGNPTMVLHQLEHDPIRHLGEVAPDTDAELDELVARAVHRDPAARFQTATEMRHALEAYMRRAGHLVREPEVGEAMAAAFHDVRMELRTQIQTAMSKMASDPPLRASEPTVVAAEVAPSPRAQIRGRRRWLAVAIAGAAVACAGIGVLAGAREAALCASPIRVRVMYDMTGDTREVGMAAGKGEYDYLRAINSAGGIRGCKLEIDVADTQYDKRASLDVYRAWKARPDWPEVSTIFLQGTPMTQTLAPLAAADGKIVMSSAYAGELAAPGPTSVDIALPSLNDAFSEASVPVRKQSPGYANVFFQGTDYTTAARVAANFAWRQGARRMAFFYCSKSTFCTDPVDGAKTFLKQLGGTQIGRDLVIELGDDASTIERKVMQFFGQERAYQAAHPEYQVADWIWFGNTSPNTSALGRAIDKARREYGLAIHVIGNNWSVDESLYRQCGDACVGFYVVQPYALFGDPTMPGTARLLADHATYRRLDGEPSEAYRTVQYVYGRVAVAAWRLAVERLLAERKPITGGNLRAMLETFQSVDVEGFATISYTATDHRPQSGVRVTQLGPRGRMETIGPPMSLSLQSGWLGW
ncbi:MAG TPA: bifunctional serine/threonine-protein kinase/ABC transporter substrate-binding protein [Kofleriaceae bacterium]|nr:bifunctional serine/threonine-protein kinase/ABC transporter substrate-binding protein [Kofleriaceae bacterium]